MADLAEAEKSGTATFDVAFKDPKVFLAGKGVKLPAEATAEITKNSPVGVKVCLNGHCVSISISTF